MMSSFVADKLEYDFPVYDASQFMAPNTIKQSSQQEEPSKQPSIISVGSECDTILMDVEGAFQKHQTEKISHREDQNQINKVVLQPAKFTIPDTLQLRPDISSCVHQLFSDSDPESELQPLPPSPPPDATIDSGAIFENGSRNTADNSTKELPKKTISNQEMVQPMESSKKDGIIEGRSLSSDDGFDPSSARMKFPATTEPLQKRSARPAFGINRSPKKPMNFSSGRGRPLERPKGALKPTSASTQALLARMQKARKPVRPKQEKENAFPRARAPSPKRILPESDKAKSQNNSSTSFGGSASSQQTSSSVSDDLCDEIDPNLPQQLLFWGSKHLDYSEETGLGYIIGEVTEILNGPGLFILKYSKMNEHRDYRILQKRLNDIYGNKTGNQFSFNQMTKFDAGCYGIYHYKNENYVRAKIIPKQTTDNGQITSSNNAADFKLYLVDLGIQLSTFDNRTIYTYPKQLNSHKNHLKDLLCLPECSFPCFLTGIKPANNSNRYPKIICDRFSDLVGLNKKIAVNIFLPSKKQRSRLDPFMRQKYGGMIPLSIDVKASANGYQVHSTLGTEMQKENSVLLDQSTTFKIDLDQSEKTLIGSSGKRGPNRFYQNYFTVCQELPKDFVVEMPAKSRGPSKTKESSNPSSPRSCNDSNVTTSLSPPPLSQYGPSKMISTRSSSNDTSIIHETSQQPLLKLPQNQYFKYGNFYNMGQLMPPPAQITDSRPTPLYINNNQDIPNVRNMLPPQNVIVNNYILPYGIDPYSYSHNHPMHPHNMPPPNGRSYPYSNQFQRPSGPSPYGRNFFSKK